MKICNFEMHKSDLGRGMRRTNLETSHCGNEQTISDHATATPLNTESRQGRLPAAKLVGTMSGSSTPVFISTPVNQGDNPIQQLTELFSQISQQISNSTALQLASNRASTAGVSQHNHLHSSGETQPIETHNLDLSKLSVVIKSDAHEPPVFRGDGSENCSIQEREEIVKANLKNKGCQVSEQAEEILNRLIGKARDVVKIGNSQ